ncbi:MAG: alpha/beta fold hydrolase [Methylosarcina sp.]
MGRYFWRLDGSVVRFCLMEVVDLVFTEYGKPTSEPLIILHGFFASSRNWRQIAEKLSDQFHVYIPDMRNHGASPRHPIMDYPSMSADLKEFIERHGLNNANLLGHSMGGKVAMWFALNHPDLFNKLIIADIAPVSYSHSFSRTIQALKTLPLTAITSRKQAEEWLAEFLPDPAYRQFLLQNLVLSNGHYQWRVDLDIFYNMAPNIVAFPVANHLAPYSREALFIAGENSDFVEMENITPLFPSAVLNTIPDAGHWLHVQQPEIFIKTVGRFLKFC